MGSHSAVQLGGLLVGVDPADSELLEYLGIGAGARVWSGGRSDAAKRAVNRVLDGVDRPTTGPVDVAVLTPATADEAIYFADKVRNRLAADARIWIVVATGASADADRPSRYGAPVDAVAPFRDAPESPPPGGANTGLPLLHQIADAMHSSGWSLHQPSRLPGGLTGLICTKP